MKGNMGYSQFNDIYCWVYYIYIYHVQDFFITKIFYVSVSVVAERNKSNGHLIIKMKKFQPAISSNQNTKNVLGARIDSSLAKTASIQGK